MSPSRSLVASFPTELAGNDLPWEKERDGVNLSLAVQEKIPWLVIPVVHYLGRWCSGLVRPVHPDLAQDRAPYLARVRHRPVAMLKYGVVKTSIGFRLNSTWR